MTCGDCRFWMKYSNKKFLGQCRKRAPVAQRAVGRSFLVLFASWDTMWLATVADQYCYEFEERRAK